MNTTGGDACGRQNDGSPKVAEDARTIVERAFEEWTNGTGYVSRLFAPQMTWEIVGRSAASARYRSAEEFVATVLEPFGRRFSETEPFRPVKIRGVYSDGPTVIVLWDGAGKTVTGTTYENTYAWVLTLDHGVIVDGIAFYDSIAFNDLWDIAPRAE
jgi:ketosteroid isomerase-like protein